MNWFFFGLYLGIGSLVKLITLKHPSPGEQYSAAAVVVLESCLMGLIVPAGWDYRWLLVATIPHAGGGLLRFGTYAIDSFRIWREGY